MKNELEIKPLRVKLGPIGATEAPEFAIGRQDLVQDLWKSLKSNGIRLLAERRMGKTWLLHLAIACKPDWAVPIFFDTEGCQNVGDFVLQLNRTLHREGLLADNWWNSALEWSRRYAQRIQGKTVLKVTVPEVDTWQDFLEDTCRHFVAACGDDRTPVLMFDELPLLVDNVLKAEGEKQASSLLDTLRRIRQTQPRLRMIYCGSLGLHVVLKKLQDAGYTGQPANDLPAFEAPPLADNDAWYLAACLLLGEEVSCDDLPAVASGVALASSGVPFYIQTIVSWMANRRSEPWTEEKAAGVPEQMFSEPGDPGQFAYYEGRLGQYYAEDQADKARAALDILSRDPAGLHFNDLLNLVRHRPKTVSIDPDELHAVMRTLRDDYYVVKSSGSWRFKLEIVRRWWHAERGGIEL